MLVGERMTKDPIVVTREAGVDDALRLMRDRNIRRLPVVDKNGSLVGIVSDKDLYLASPSPATSLDIFELRYLLSRLTVEKIMSTPVITVTPKTPLEEAARIMADRKIGGLPVLEGEDLVGIITESDLFKIFVDLLGARRSGVRATMIVPDIAGELATLTSAITLAGGNFIALSTLAGARPGTSEVMLKVSGLDLAAVQETLGRLNGEIYDIREA